MCLLDLIKNRQRILLSNHSQYFLGSYHNSKNGVKILEFKSGMIFTPEKEVFKLLFAVKITPKILLQSK